MNKHALKTLFEELSKEYLRSGAAGATPDILLRKIWEELKKIREEFNQMSGE